MAARTRWIDDNGEKRQRILHELSQLKQMSLALRTQSIRSFRERSAAPVVKRASPPLTPATPIAA